MRDQAPNVIASEVTVSVDARAQSDEALDSLLTELTGTAAGSARQSGCDCEAAVGWREPAVTMSPAVAGALAAAARHRGVSEIAATSRAGHDAGILATAGVPAGLLFVRAGRAGLSHSPHETVDAPDIAVAIEALARALADLGDSAPSPA